MELTHSFTVPTAVDAAWSHFQDIGGLAECFPGAQVTAVGEDADGHPTFEGTCKVKLGPIALVYAGAGSFTERDESAGRFVVVAKGRDKRGNGTAGATVTVTMAADGPATRVEVVTDLAITGKPAQFGRGVMQDVSDKLLGQFVTCLEQRLAGDVPPTEDSAAAGTDPEPAAAAPPPASVPAPTPAPARAAPAPTPADDALDLGSTVVPILLRTYGKKAAIGLGVVALLALLRRVLSR
ncbi:SRPBCC family protein [Nocardioides caeni]|uniref:Carbon monoxide dehydrogenase n=1 Tax=Nocardioides caeni TaxID=574700 RepID=A0A4S8N711_9ACTN|nr:SRPBCC family protein [Nocardioides caeni]THV12077.1 carbon monoxide dehydrogenase [Nocardioides caeni]